MKRTANTRFAVAAAYHGECCAKAHVWVAIVSAPTAKAAEALHRRRVRRDKGEYDIGDVIAIAVPA